MKQKREMTTQFRDVLPRRRRPRVRCLKSDFALFQSTTHLLCQMQASELSLLHLQSCCFAYLTYCFFDVLSFSFLQLSTFIALENCEKECNMLEIVLVQGFRPLKIKITQFPNGFQLNK